MRPRRLVHIVVMVSLLSGAAKGDEGEDRYQGPLPSWSGACGPACLALIAKLHGHDVRLADIRRLVPREEFNATSLATLSDLATRVFGLHTAAAEVDREALERLTVPAIVYQEPNHFVAVVGRGAGKGIMVADPPKEFRPSDGSEFRTGRVRLLAVSKAPIGLLTEDRSHKARVAYVVAVGLLLVAGLALARRRGTDAHARVASV